MARLPCAKCGQSRRAQTTLIDRTAAPRTGTSSVRYMVGGKRFSTLTAAQDHAASNPGSVIKQM